MNIEKRLNKTLRKKVTFLIGSDVAEKLQILSAGYKTSKTRLVEALIRNHKDQLESAPDKSMEVQNAV